MSITPPVRIPMFLLIAGLVQPTVATGQSPVVAVRGLEPARQAPFVVDTVWLAGGADDRGGVAFGSIGGMAVDSSGRVLVADYQLRVIHVLRPSGEFLRVLGGPGDGPGEYRLPARVSVAPDGHVFVLDQYSGRITEYDATLALLRSFMLEERLDVRSFIATSDGLVMSGVDASPLGPDAVIHEFARADGRLVRRFGRLRPIRSPELTRRAGAGPLTRGSDGTWWYATPGPYRIQRFSTTGTPLLTIDRPNRFLPPAEDATIATSEGDRVTFSRRPQAYVSRISVLPGGRVLHQVITESGEVISDELRIVESGGPIAAELARSWVGGLPVLLEHVGGQEFLIYTVDPATRAQGVARIRVREGRR